MNYSEQQFQNFISRIRDGDEDAARELVEEFEPEIRRMVRLRLANSQVQRAFDSTDICQSVFANFFVRASLGQFEFESPQQILSLLAVMAKNRLVHRIRHENVRRPKGDNGTIFYGDLATEYSVPDRELQTPSKEIGGQEILAKFEQRLNDSERQISKLRQQGLTWKEISDQLGEPADKLRKRLARACNRILGQLDLLGLN